MADVDKISARNALTPKQVDANIFLFHAYDGLLQRLVQQHRELAGMRAQTVLRLLDSGIASAEVATRLGISEDMTEVYAAKARQQEGRTP